MNKKSLVFLSLLLLTITVFSGFVYANENTVSDHIKSGINEAGTTVVDGAERLGNDIRNGIGSAENGIEDALKIDDNSRDENDRNNNVGTLPGNYTATRVIGDDAGTASDAGLMNNSTMWVWLIIAVAAVVIVALIWYYATQETTTNHRHHDDE